MGSRNRKIFKPFMPEQIEILAANPFTSKVDQHHIWFTLDFLSRYEKGETSTEILPIAVMTLKYSAVHGYTTMLGCCTTGLKRDCH